MILCLIFFTMFEFQSLTIKFGTIPLNINPKLPYLYLLGFMILLSLILDKIKFFKLWELEVQLQDRIDTADRYINILKQLYIREMAYKSTSILSYITNNKQLYIGIKKSFVNHFNKIQKEFEINIHDTKYNDELYEETLKICFRHFYAFPITNVYNNIKSKINNFSVHLVFPSEQTEFYNKNKMISYYRKMKKEFIDAICNSNDSKLKEDNTLNEIKEFIIQNFDAIEEIYIFLYDELEKLDQIENLKNPKNFIV